MPVDSVAPLSTRRDLWILFFVALGFRLAHLLATRGDPVFDVPMLDAEYLVDWARQIQSEGVGASPEHTAYFRTPLYPLLLAGLFQLPGDDLGTARLVQALLGSISVIWLFGITFRRFGKRAAWATGILAASAWPLLHYGRELLITTLGVFLVTAVLVALDRATSRSGVGRWLALGALCALAALAWASLAVLLPAVLIHALTIDRVGPPPLASGARPATRVLLVSLGFALLIAPNAWRNWKASGEFVPLASQGGINFYIGNNSQADGMSASLPGFSSWRNEDVEAMLAREHGRPLKPGEQDVYFRNKALDFIRESPGRALALLLRKTYLFAQGYEIRNDVDLDSIRERSPILRLPLPDFGWLGPLAFLGLVASRKRWRESAHLMVTAVALSGIVILFFVCARYRMTAWPPLLVFAGAGVAGILDSGRAPLSRAGLLLTLTGAFVLARIDFLEIRHPDASQPHFQYGNVYARVGRFDDARREYEEALQIAPDFGEARYHLGALSLEQGDLSGAIRELTRAAELLPDSFRAKRSLAEALEARGNMDAAIELRRQIIELTQGEPEDVHAYARALGSAKRYAEAWVMFQRLLEHQKEKGGAEDPHLLVNAGQTALALGLEAEGIALLDRARAVPGNVSGADETVALYYLATHRYEEALHSLSDALLRTPDRLELLRLRAAARYTTGDATGAIEDLQVILSKDPTDSEAQSRLTELRQRLESANPETFERARRTP